MPTTQRLTIWLAGILVAGGCAPLAKAPSSARLPAVRLAPDAAVLDIAFVRLPAADQEGYRRIWEAADELAFSAELRRELAANGLRVGILGPELPARLHELLETPRNPLEVLSENDGADPEITGSKQHLPLRSGHRAKIKASTVHSALALLLSEHGQVRGYQLTDAQCLVALRQFPQPDGRVKLELTPEIEHGAVKSRWTGGEGMMIQQTGQDRLVLDRLRLESLISPGQSLLVSTTSDIKGLGEHFFSETAGSAVQRRLLVVRVAQTQLDDLFAAEPTPAPPAATAGK
jgi:hypothetical protein